MSQLRYTFWQNKADVAWLKPVKSNQILCQFKHNAQHTTFTSTKFKI